MLIFLLILGFGVVLKSQKTQITIGFAGGLFLLWMGIGLLRDLRKAGYAAGASYKTGPVITGFILSIGNPYFLLWWATVGLNLALKAQALGVLALVLFAIVHWLCDLVWLHLLAVLALLRVLPEGWLRKLVSFWGAGAVAALLVISIPFMGNQVRLGLDPQIEQLGYYSRA